MIEAKFALFEMKIKHVTCNAVELRQSPFGIRAERFYAVNICIATYKFILSMVYPEVFFVTDINRPVIATPAIGMDNTIDTYFASNDLLQLLFLGTGNDFGIHIAITLQGNKHNGFTTYSTATFSPDTTWPK